MTIPRNTITGDVSTGYRPAPIPKPPKKKPPRKTTIPNFGGGYDPYAATTTQVNAIIQSMLDSVKSDKAAAAAQAQQEAAAAYARGQALAYGLQKLGIANNVQAIFQNAMNAGSGLASGFSGATRDQAAAQAADQAKTLVGTGQEGAVRNEGDAMGNVIYGLGGYIPGNKLNTLGAAFGAQAALQPGFAEQFGALDQARILNDWASKGASTYDQQIQKIIGEKPSLFMSTLNQNRSYAQQERNFRYKQAVDQINADLAAKRITISEASLRLRQAQAVFSSGSGNPNYYVDAQGRTVPKGYRYNPAGELIRIPSPRVPRTTDPAANLAKQTKARDAELAKISGIPPEARTFLGVGDNGTVKTPKRTRAQLVKYLVRIYWARTKRYGVKQKRIVELVNQMVGAMPADWFIGGAASGSGGKPGI